MSSLNQQLLVDFQDHVLTHKREIARKARIGSPTLDLVQQRPGVIGKETLTSADITNLMKRYKGTWDPTQDAITQGLRVLETYKAKIDLEFTPGDYEKQYRGDLDRSGRSASEWSFWDWLFDNLVTPQERQEKEIAVWQAVQTLTPADGDLLNVMFDGYHKLIADEQTANNLDPVLTGAITDTNAVSSLENMYMELGSAYFTMGVDIMMSPKARMRLLQDYRERYGKFVTDEHGMPKLDIGSGMDRFHALPGMKEHAIVITPATNLVLGHDGMDANYEADTDTRQFRTWKDQYIGVQIELVDNDIIVTNDQH